MLWKSLCWSQIFVPEPWMFCRVQKWLLPCEAVLINTCHCICALQLSQALWIWTRSDVRTCSCICQPGRAHNDVFIAALYQLQEEGWYLIWHKIYWDKITWKKKKELKFIYVSRMVWYLLMVCLFFLSWDFTAFLGTEHPQAAVTISLNHILQLLILHINN